MKKVDFKNGRKTYTDEKYGTRVAMKALRIALLTNDEYASPTIIAIKKPEGLELSTFSRTFKEKLVFILINMLADSNITRENFKIWACGRGYAMVVFFLKPFP